jgi:dipeptide transport system ATP-binding protein
MNPVLKVRDLTVEFTTLRGKIRAVDRLSFELKQGETLGIVGESGCGKSMTSLALMGLLPSNGKLSASELKFEGRDLLRMDERERRKLRGGSMAMIFQDPMTSLNPSFTVEQQITETLAVHVGGTRQELSKKTVELLGKVGIPAPESRLKSYPHQLSGGMSQRVMIAMAIACEPRLLIADEPTTALDVTIQSQILELLKALQAEKQMSLILITHDIGVVADMADRILVMYAGQGVEEQDTNGLIARPHHPYTQSLLACLPATHTSQPARTRLPSILGMVPDLANRPRGCQLHPRCFKVQPRCQEEEPQFESGVRCFYPNTPTPTNERELRP